MTPVRNPLASPLLASLLRDGFEVQLEVTGSSMYPRIRSGDLVRVQPIAGIRSAKGLSPGQIILFNNRAGDLCLHRVVAVSRGRVETQGDSVSERDGSVPNSAVLGVAVAVRSQRGVWQRLDKRTTSLCTRYAFATRRGRRLLRDLRLAIRARRRAGKARAGPVVHPTGD